MLQIPRKQCELPKTSKTMQLSFGRRPACVHCSSLAAALINRAGFSGSSAAASMPGRRTKTQLFERSQDLQGPAAASPSKAELCISCVGALSQLCPLNFGLRVPTGDHDVKARNLENTKATWTRANSEVPASLEVGIMFVEGDKRLSL